MVSSGEVFRQTPIFFIRDTLIGAAFTGRHKQQLDTYDPVLKGGNVEGFLLLGDSTSRWSIAPGLGLVNRTLDDATMNNLVATLNTYSQRDTFTPRYNTYAFSLYNTLRAGPYTARS